MTRRSYSGRGLVHLFIVGQSDSAGTNLAPPAQPWPQLLQARLQERSAEPIELTHVRFFAAGPGAADFILRKIEEADPDAVVLVLSAYACSLALSVRRRYGERVGGYHRLERDFDRRTFERAGAAGFSNSLARRIARRTLGAQTVATVAEVAGIYEAVIRGLAQREGVNVLAMADTYFSGFMQKHDPVIRPSVDAFRARLRPVVEAHRFAWADAEIMMSRSGNREEMFGPDGAHKTPAGHERYAEDIAAALEKAGFVTGASPAPT